MDVMLKKIRYVQHKSTFYKQEHTHDLWELAYYVNGHGTVSQNGVSQKYSNGYVHLVRAGTPHDENNEAQSKIILLYFDADRNPAVPGIYRDKSGTVLSAIRRLNGEIQENLPYKQEMANLILQEIFLGLKRLQVPSHSENRGFSHIIRYIDENFQFDLDVHKIAADAFYSYDRFRHVFKEHTGVSPHRYINNKRVDLAKFLIDTDPAMSLSALAKECGYTSLSQFSNSFRAKFKVSPSQYKSCVENKTEIFI